MAPLDRTGQASGNKSSFAFVEQTAQEVAIGVEGVDQIENQIEVVDA